jgi:hypothetical protein
VSTAEGDLKMTNLIPESAFKFGIFSIQERNGVLKAYMGSNQSNNFVNSVDITFRGGIKAYKKIYISILFDSYRKFTKMYAIADDIMVPFDITLANAPQMISLTSMIYNHPAITNIRLNVVNPRFDYDFENYYYQSQMFTDDRITSGICSSNDKNCSKCIFVTADNSLSCNKCVNSFKLVDTICLNELNIPK